MTRRPFLLSLIAAPLAVLGKRKTVADPDPYADYLPHDHAGFRAAENVRYRMWVSIDGSKPYRVKA